MVQNETEFNHAGKYVSIVKLSTYSCTHVNSYRNTWFKDKLVTPHSRNSNDYCDMIQNTPPVMYHQLYMYVPTLHFCTCTYTHCLLWYKFVYVLMSETHGMILMNIIQQSVTCTSSTDHIVALPNNYTKMNASFRRTSEQKLWTVKWSSLEPTI